MIWARSFTLDAGELRCGRCRVVVACQGEGAVALSRAPGLVAWLLVHRELCAAPTPPAE